MEQTNFQPFQYADLLGLYDREKKESWRLLDRYQKEPCSSTFKFFSVHRDYLEEIKREIDAREEIALDNFPIEAALIHFDIPFTRAAGQTFIDL